jgi:hypothetical protein
MSAPSNEVSSGGKGLRLVLLALIGIGLAAIWILARNKPESGEANSGGDVASSQTGRAAPPWQGSSTGANRGPGNIDPDATPKIEAWLSERFDLPDSELIDGLLQFSRRRDVAMAEKAKALEHALNLIPDPEYQKLDALINDPAIPASMLDTVFTDMHNRNEQAAIHASLLFLKRSEAEVAANGKALLAHLLDMDEESDTEAIRMQGETRLIELAEAKKEMDVVELPPDSEPPPPVLPEDPAEIPGVDPLPAPGQE